VELGDAERIGHGVDVMYEDRPRDLLTEMAARHIMVEINLSSNEGILGVEGRCASVSVYRSAHVPVALSTDDEGVSRIDLTHEYVRAAHRLRPELPRPEATGADGNGARLSARREPVGKAG
jgi:adenosine deaminase